MNRQFQIADRLAWSALRWDGDFSMGPTWWPHDQVSHRSDSSPPLEHTNILRTLSWRVLWCGGRYWRDEWPTDRKTEQITSCQEMSEYRTNDEHVPLPWRGQPADGLSMAHATGCLIIWWVNNIYHLPVSHLLLFCPARHWLAADSVRNLIPIWKYGDDIHYPRFNFCDFFECAASLKMSTERSTCNLQKKRSDWRTSLPPGRHGRLTEQWKPTPIAIITKKNENDSLLLTEPPNFKRMNTWKISERTTWAECQRASDNDLRSPPSSGQYRNCVVQDKLELC